MILDNQLEMVTNNLVYELEEQESRKPREGRLTPYQPWRRGLQGTPRRWLRAESCWVKVRVVLMVSEAQHGAYHGKQRIPQAAIQMVPLGFCVCCRVGRQLYWERKGREARVEGWVL